MRSPALAIGWEIWARGRAAIVSVAVLFAVGTLLIPVLHGSGRWAGLANPIAYALTATALLVTLGCFHFTEGSLKGGFGSFPARLFHLPMPTRWLVGWPMIYGSAAMALVYLLCARLLLRHLGPDLPVLWPCLYLVFGLTQFQMIIWSLPEGRYLKLLCLSIAASIITFGWMFFIPTIVAGALSEWGYSGDPEVFMNRLLVGLAWMGPAAYAVSLWRVQQQRHGSTARFGTLSGLCELTVGRLLRRRAPFRSASHALFWLEWRRTGFILPVVVLVILALTCVPAWLSGGLSARATTGILTWLSMAPFLFALIIGRGYGKPDFWSSNLKIAPFHAIRPVSAGQWVVVKLKVGLASAVLAWALVIYLGFLWTAFAGDLQGPGRLLSQIRFYYSPVERWLLLSLGLPTVVIVTWRFLVASLPASVSGRKLWHLLVNGFVGVCLVAAFVLTIWRSDNEDHSLFLYNLWPAVEWVPAILTLAVVVKMGVAAHGWTRALQRRMASPGSVAAYLAGWLFAVGIVAAFFFILCRNTLWLRHLLLLASVVIVPLAGPPLAMRAFSANRSNP